jgi:hypothetical protein
MLTSALSATRTKKPLTTTRSAGGIRAARSRRMAILPFDGMRASVLRAKNGCRIDQRPAQLSVVALGRQVVARGREDVVGRVHARSGAPGEQR